MHFFNIELDNTTWKIVQRQFLKNFVPFFHYIFISFDYLNFTIAPRLKSVAQMKVL